MVTQAIGSEVSWSARAAPILKLLPGLILVAAIGIVARLVGTLLPPTVSEVLVAILVGLFIKNTIDTKPMFVPGIRFAMQRVLRLAIILLGARLSLSAVVATGALSLVVIVLGMAFAFGVAYIGGRVLRLPTKLVTLIAVGTAVCGNSAIIATAPVIEAEERDVSFAVATITLFGTLAVLVYPFLGYLAGFSDPVFGIWAGAAVNDTSQVVATGFAYSEQAGQVATIVKLTRNTLMAPVIILIAYWAIRSGQIAQPEGGRGKARFGFLQVVPLFVLGFIAMALLNTLGVFPQPLIRVFDEAAKFGILMALAGVGLGTSIASMRRTGLRPLYLGLMTAVLLSLMSLALIHVTGLPAAIPVP